MTQPPKRPRADVSGDLVAIGWSAGRLLEKRRAERQRENGALRVRRVQCASCEAWEYPS